MGRLIVPRGLRRVSRRSLHGGLQLLLRHGKSIHEVLHHIVPVVRLLNIFELRNPGRIRHSSISARRLERERHVRVPALAFKLDREDIVVLLLRGKVWSDRVRVGAESGVLGPLSLVSPEQHVERRILMACGYCDRGA